MVMNHNVLIVDAAVKDSETSASFLAESDGPKSLNERLKYLAPVHPRTNAESHSMLAVTVPAYIQLGHDAMSFIYSSCSYTFVLRS